LKEHLFKYNLESHWITDYDREEINLTTLIAEYSTIANAMSISENYWFSIYLKPRKLRLSEISLLLKHNFAWKHSVENNFENSLVLEDDALLCNDFLNKFNQQIEMLPQSYDIVWVGSCCNLHINSVENEKYLYRNNGSRCTHGYLINSKCASKMIDYLKKNSYPADFLFNKAILDLNLESYWMEPDLISQNPIFETSIQKENDFR
jgi:GR25 family glycosyltransferase involved in LPS biosynthesis